MKCQTFKENCEKWLIILVQMCDVIALIIIAILCDQISDSLSTNSGTNSLFQSKTALVLVIVIPSVLSITFFMVGIYGTYYEDHCLFMVFFVFINIFGICALLMSIHIPAVIPMAVINLCLTALCIKHHFSLSDQNFKNILQGVCCTLCCESHGYII